VSTKLSGRAAAPGAAVAPAFVLAPQPVLTKLPEVASGAPAEELTRLLDALRRAESELRELAVTVSASAGEDRLGRDDEGRGDGGAGRRGTAHEPDAHEDPSWLS